MEPEQEQEASRNDQDPLASTNNQDKDEHEASPIPVPNDREQLEESAGKEVALEQEEQQLQIPMNLATLDEEIARLTRCLKTQESDLDKLKKVIKKATFLYYFFRFIGGTNAMKLFFIFYFVLWVELIYQINCFN